MHPTDRPVVVGLAGRRIDAPGAAPSRFPLARVPEVRERLRDVLRHPRVAQLVSSAACGADLIALEIAAEQKIPTRIVLPFAPDEFRKSSVADRPGDWGERFDRMVRRAETLGTLLVLEAPSAGDSPYAAANRVILDETQRLARDLDGSPLALIVWDGERRGSEDFTAAFAQEARSRGMEVIDVSTRENPGGVS